MKTACDAERVGNCRLYGTRRVPAHLANLGFRPVDRDLPMGGASPAPLWGHSSPDAYANGPRSAISDPGVLTASNGQQTTPPVSVADAGERSRERTADAGAAG
jgi:hypothetical protein